MNAQMLLTADDAAATLWTSGRPQAAISNLRQRVHRSEAGVREIVQLILWQQAMGDSRKIDSLLIHLAKQLRLDEQPLAAEHIPAIDALLKLLDPNSTSTSREARLFLLIASVAESKYGPKPASKLYHAAIARDANLLKAYVGLARSLAVLRKHRHALQTVDVGVSRFSRCTELYAIGLRLALQTRQDDAAVEYGRRWLRVEPNDRTALTTTVRLLYLRRDFDRCRQLLAGALAAEPDNVDWLVALAALWMQDAFGDARTPSLVQARSILERCARLNGQNPDIAARLSQVVALLADPTAPIPVYLQQPPEWLDPLASMVPSQDGLEGPVDSSVAAPKSSAVDFDAELLSSLPDSVAGAVVVGRTKEQGRSVIDADSLTSLSETQELDEPDPYVR